MSRLLPRSLLGQVMLALAAALVVAQGISGFLLYRAAEQRRETALVHSAAFQFMSGRAAPPGTRPAFRDRRRSDEPMMALPRLPRDLRYEKTPASPLQAGEIRNADREEALREILEDQGIALADLVVTERAAATDPLVRKLAGPSSALRDRLSDRELRIIVVGIHRQGEAGWQVIRMPRPLPDSGLIPGIVIQTGILFAVLFGLLYVVLRRITRPLGDLAERTHRFAGAAKPEAPLEPSGPDDIRRLIDAHNAMQARIGAMLDEKNVMLGAIGHDLKTPLAALRVRIEAVEDDAARERMARTIEEIAVTLDDILSLARVGRSDAPPERTDLAALVGAVVEEYEDMGAAVEMGTTERLVAPVHVLWVKRGLRNLVGNALRYAGSATVSVLRSDGMAILRVEDSGPGIPADRITAMLEPFARGEQSRNRETGGAGLGLALTRAIAEQHGGSLKLANRAEGGLVAELRLPLG